jgi:hypothetical protein
MLMNGPLFKFEREKNRGAIEYKKAENRFLNPFATLTILHELPNFPLRKNQFSFFLHFINEMTIRLGKTNT